MFESSLYYLEKIYDEMYCDYSETNYGNYDIDCSRDKHMLEQFIIDITEYKDTKPLRKEYIELLEDLKEEYAYKSEIVESLEIFINYLTDL